MYEITYRIGNGWAKTALIDSLSAEIANDALIKSFGHLQQKQIEIIATLRAPMDTPYFVG